MIQLEISETPIELYRVLKLANMAESGGAAKQVIAGGLVTVNDAVETRKRKKIFTGDIVGFSGEAVCIKAR